MASRGVKYCVRVRVWESARRDGKQCDQKELKKTNLKKKICVWPLPLFLLSAHKQCILSNFIHNRTVMLP
jgi:hypothetical protein